MKNTNRLTAMAMLALLLLQTASCASNDAGKTDDTNADNTPTVTEAVTEDPKLAHKRDYFASLQPISAAGAEIAFWVGGRTGPHAGRSGQRVSCDS